MKVYVHVPFCSSKCAYCDFYSTPKREWMEAYTNAVVNEWKLRSRDLTEPVDTLYFGGGTPSSLPLQLLDRILEAIPVNNSTLREATIEANPEDVSDDWVRHILTNTPFRRVSMGIQSFDDAQLLAIGRRHTAADAVEAVGRLRNGGIDNISCDLIYGLPLQDVASWEHSLSGLINLRPEHISAYLLSYEEGTRLTARLKAGKITEADDTTVEKMYATLCEKTSSAGYNHYEISNFSLPGFEAIHNSSYWDGSPYIGLGPGAHSWDGAVRSFNPSNLKLYIDSRGAGFGQPEEEDDDNRFNDMLITRLRTTHGLRLQEITAHFGQTVAADFLRDSAPLVREGLLNITDGDRYTIPERHWLLSNSILLKLIRV